MYALGSCCFGERWFAFCASNWCHRWSIVGLGFRPILWQILWSFLPRLSCIRCFYSGWVRTQSGVVNIEFLSSGRSGPWMACRVGFPYLNIFLVYGACLFCGWFPEVWCGHQTSLRWVNLIGGSFGSFGKWDRFRPWLWDRWFVFVSRRIAVVERSWRSGLCGTAGLLRLCPFFSPVWCGEVRVHVHN